MNVIYSFKVFKQKYYKPFDSTFFKLAKLSVDVAKQNYNTIFYCDSASEIMFRENGITFDKVIWTKEIEDYDGELPGVVKILAMMKQTEPYIISDFDSIIFKKLIQRHTIDFAYPEILNFQKDEMWFRDYDSNYLHQFYKKPWLKYGNKFKINNKKSDELPSHISNHSLVLVSHPILISKIYQQILSVLTIAQQNECVSMFIEQFLLTYYLHHLDVDYGYISENAPITNDITYELFRHDFVHLINYNTDENIDNKLNFISDIYLKKL